MDRYDTLLGAGYEPRISNDFPNYNDIAPFSSSFSIFVHCPYSEYALFALQKKQTYSIGQVAESLYN